MIKIIFGQKIQETKLLILLINPRYDQYIFLKIWRQKKSTACLIEALEACRKDELFS